MTRHSWNCELRKIPRLPNPVLLPIRHDVGSIVTILGSTLTTTFTAATLTLTSILTGPGSENLSFVFQACRKRRLNVTVCRNNRIKRLAPCRCLDGHVKEPSEMSMSLGARPPCFFFFGGGGLQSLYWRLLHFYPILSYILHPTSYIQHPT